MLEVLSSDFLTGVPWEFFYADDLVLIVDMQEECYLQARKKSKKTLFNVGQCKQYNISSHLKWVLVAVQGMEGWYGK